MSIEGRETEAPTAPPSRAIFTVPGRPVAKARPRMARNGHVYTPAKTESYEGKVGLLARPHFPSPLNGPVRVTIRATFVPAKSWSRRKREAHLHRPHCQKPDIDNVAKAVLDGLNRIAFADDAQIAQVDVSKVWGEAEKVVVTVEALGP